MTPCRIFPVETLTFGDGAQQRVVDFINQHKKSVDHFEQAPLRGAGEITRVYIVFNNRPALDAFGKKFGCAGFSAGSRRVGKE